MAVNPQSAQGSLNRVLTHLVVPSFPQLNLTASFLGKSQISVSMENDAVDQIPSATGLVNSPEVFQKASITASLLRSQAASGLWLAQQQLQSIIGSMSVWSDSAVFPPYVFSNCSIVMIEPGAFDGSDPAVKVTIKGVYYINASLWADAGAVPSIF